MDFSQILGDALLKVFAIIVITIVILKLGQFIIDMANDDPLPKPRREIVVRQAINTNYKEKYLELNNLINTLMAASEDYTVTDTRFRNYFDEKVAEVNLDIEEEREKRKNDGLRRDFSYLDPYDG